MWSRYLSPGGGGEVRWKQLLKLWVKVSPLPCFPPFSPKEDEIQRRSELKMVVEVGVVSKGTGAET